MEKRYLGNSGIEVSPIGFGAWAIGGWQWGGADRRDALNALHACLDLGITTIDTAPVYGFGYSEKLVGEAIKGKREKFQILTKFGLRWDTDRGEYFFNTEDEKGNALEIRKYASRHSIMRECDESLKRLGIDYIDLYQIHWPDKTTPIAESMEAVIRLMEQGKIRAAGVSNYSVEQMLEASGTVSLASNQLPYSMVRRDIEKDIVPWCTDNNCAIIAYSPLQRGLLSGKITPDYPFNPGDSRPETPYFRINNIIRTNIFLDKIKPLALEKNIKLSQLVLQWTISQPGITLALSGGRNPAQVKENAGALAVSLTGEEMTFINNEIDKLNLDLQP
ncbi:MAG: aldo/keto reductase [Bacteroidales bacterium]|nr:aldo/keto reductase [Bacteroidales bacterium]MBN2698937.1 aldo/keto reductase [Bacteroidales bacterium]